MYNSHNVVLAHSQNYEHTIMEHFYHSKKKPTTQNLQCDLILLF